MDEEFDEPSSPDRMFVWACGFSLAIGLGGVILGWLLGPSSRVMMPEWSRENAGRMVVDVLIGCAAALPVMLAVELMWKIPWEPIRELERLSESEPFQDLLSLTPLELCMISLCAGVGEELMFRGWMSPFLAGDVPVLEQPNIAIAAAVITSSVLFGCLHWISNLYVVLATLMGFYFAFLLLITDSLLVPIATHAAYDAMQLLWARHKMNSQTKKANAP